MKNDCETQTENASDLERQYDRPLRVRVIAGGVSLELLMTTTATGPCPTGGEMTADISRFQPGDFVRVLGDEGSDFRAVIA